jgi:UDP-2,3-diacylglucosamine pyrophosphatase LpxH
MRKVELVVISDTHLGTYGCRANELVDYLSQIDPETLILNGDIIDIWQFNKRYFPKAHMEVIGQIIGMLNRGTKIHYIIGNHDEMLRKFKDTEIGNISFSNKLILNLDGKLTWFFHGDVFDVTMKNSKWIAKLGGKGYDLLIAINTLVNWFSEKLGYGRLSLSKKVKDNVKSALKYINNFEQTVAEMAIHNEFDTVVCGHIHQPEIKTIGHKSGKSVQYLNAGDWIENLTSLEYHQGQWNLIRYRKKLKRKSMVSDLEPKSMSAKTSTELFSELILEFDLLKSKN